LGVGIRAVDCVVEENELLERRMALVINRDPMQKRENNREELGDTTLPDAESIKF